MSDYLNNDPPETDAALLELLRAAIGTVEEDDESESNQTVSNNVAAIPPVT